MVWEGPKKKRQTRKHDVACKSYDSSIHKIVIPFDLQQMYVGEEAAMPPCLRVSFNMRYVNDAYSQAVQKTVVARKDNCKDTANTIVPE